MLLLPFDYALGPEAAFFTMLWIIGPVMILGYWLGTAAEARVSAAAAGLSIVGLGLGVAPMLLDTPPSSIAEWVTGLAALFLGGVIGRATAQRARR
jgi:hypothetical protein